MEEVEPFFSTSRPTVYGHLNKLKALDLLEEKSVETADGHGRKAYRLRHGNLAKAWHCVEAHLPVAVENYGKTVQHLGSSWRGQRRSEMAVAPTGRR